MTDKTALNKTEYFNALAQVKQDMDAATAAASLDSYIELVATTKAKLSENVSFLKEARALYVKHFGVARNGYMSRVIEDMGYAVSDLKQTILNYESKIASLQGKSPVDED